MTDITTISGGSADVSTPGLVSVGEFPENLFVLLSSKMERAQAFADHSNSAIVTVEPTDDQKQELARSGGEQPESLHVTLASLGAISDGLDRETVEAVIAGVAERYSPFDGEVAGIGSFGKSGTDGITLALVDAPGLGEFRSDLVHLLNENGVSVRQDHDFQPHITLNYGPVPDSADLVGLPLNLDNITLRWGTEIVDVGLSGPTEEELTVAAKTVVGSTQETFVGDPAGLDIVEDSADCVESTDGESTVALVDPESGAVISCHDSVESAQEAMDKLVESEDTPDGEESSSVTEDQWAAILEFMSGIAADLGTDTTDDEDEMDDGSEPFAAISPHDTPTSVDTWDGPENEKKVTSPSDEDYFARIYAWRDDEADTTVKAAYRFIHHFVGDDGTPGDASTVAASTGIGVLNGARGGTTIPSGDREGVYKHLASHLSDADLEPPELMSLQDAGLLAQAVEEGVVVNPTDHRYMSDLVDLYYINNPVDPNEDFDTTATEIVAEFGPLASHSTPTINPATFEGWNGDEAKKRTRQGEDQSYYARIFAWRDEDRAAGSKTAYKFIHHVVDQDGNPGAAVMWAAHSAITVIDDSTIPTSDYQGVFNHLARHLRDGGVNVPDLGEAEPITDVESAIGDMRAQWFEQVANLAGKRDITELNDGELIGEIVHRWVEQSQSTLTPQEQQELETELGLSDDSVQELAGDDEIVDGPNSQPDGTDGDSATSSDDTIIDGDVVSGDFEWEGVLIVEGVVSGDGRLISEGTLTWRKLPLPLMLQTVNAEGHDGAAIAGSIQEIERVGQEIIGRGSFDSGEQGKEARRLIAEGTMRGVSADIDMVTIEFQDASGGQVDPLDAMLSDDDILQVLIEGRLMGATLTPFPAFQEAQVHVIDADIASDDEALVASGYERGDVWRFTSPVPIALQGERMQRVSPDSLVASAGNKNLTPPLNPPTSWFELDDMGEPEEFQVYADGRCYGLIARWGSCHIGFSDKCVGVPHTENRFSAFHKPGVVTDEGEQVLCGPVYMDTVHPNLRLLASDAEAHYADTGCAVADVHLYENAWGIVAAGAVRPSASPEQVQALRGSDISPDWRRIRKNLEVVGLLAVNLSGFIVQDSLVASAGRNPQGIYDSGSGEMRSLVAAGMVQRTFPQVGSLGADVAELRAEIVELRGALRPIRAERAASRLFAILGRVGNDNGVETINPEVADVQDEAEPPCCGT